MHRRGISEEILRQIMHFPEQREMERLNFKPQH